MVKRTGYEGLRHEVFSFPHILAYVTIFGSFFIKYRSVK